MPHRTAPTAAEAGLAEPPPDIATMRATVDRLLDPDAVPGVLPPSGDELETLTATVRGHLEVLLPDVEEAARELKADSISRYGMLEIVWEARSRLEAQPSRRYGGEVGYARRLARVLNALCNHYEQLSGQGC